MQKNDRIVLNALMAGKELTDLSMDRELGVRNGRNSISRLRTVHDYNINSKTGIGKNGARYKIYYLNMQHPKGAFDVRETIEYWKTFFEKTGPMRDELAQAMHKIYNDTRKDYKEIWPEPGTSTFKQIFEKHGLQFNAPKKKSA